MTNLELVEKAKYIADNVETVYVERCFGAPMTTINKNRYTMNHPFNRTEERLRIIKSKSSNCYGFDISGFLKGILWGWCENPREPYGGAAYAINCPDIPFSSFPEKCYDIDKDFDVIDLGELCFSKLRMGIYCGDKKVIFCDLSIDGVGYDVIENYKYHAKLKYIDYI